MAARGQDGRLGKQSRRGRLMQRMTRRDTRIEPHARLNKHTHTHTRFKKVAERKWNEHRSRWWHTSMNTCTHTPTSIIYISPDDQLSATRRLLVLHISVTRAAGGRWQQRHTSVCYQRYGGQWGKLHGILLKHPTCNVCHSAVNNSSLTIILEEILWRCD